MSPNRRPLRVKFILPALTEATDPYWRPINKHFFYAAGWKKFESLWDILIRARQLALVTPLLEAVLSRITGANSQQCFDSPSNPFPILGQANSAPQPSRPNDHVTSCVS
ncbi:MAG TPA: hypothetical protein VKB47_18035 [Terracidiphilus sp.]|nr:hypothetical protein [Terracidiphilus sp.]